MLTFDILTFFTGVAYIQGCLGSVYHGYGLRQQNHSGEDPQRIVVELTEPILKKDLPKNPLFYGWFYNAEVSESLKLISEKYLANSYDYVPEFANYLDRAMYDNNITDPFAYYEKPVDPDTGRIDEYYHTTAKFCGGGIDCSAYQDRAGQYLGKKFQMHLVGLIFTRRTYGVRVKLTQEEQDIFEVDERKNTFQAVKISEIHQNLAEFNHNSIHASTEHEYEGYFQPGTVVSNHPLYPGIHFDPQYPDFHPTESRSHITIGCAKKVPAVQTGFDLLEIIDLEISGHIFHQDFKIGGGDIPIATLRQYGGDGEGEELAFVIYPSEKMVTDAVFNIYT